jgi:hypothetical protein
MLRYVALALAAAFAMPAYAGSHWSWDIGSGEPTASYRSKSYSRTPPRAARARHSARRARVMAYERRERDAHFDDDDDRDGQCTKKVRGLGTQWIGTEGAMDAAKKDWMERVRYDYGESYLDLTNAKDFESRCGRVSVGEVAGQVMYRCEIVARPCKPQMRDTLQTKKD